MMKSELIKQLGLPAICGLIWCCLLVAGLWPFHAPDNQVSWLQSGDGLSFGSYGVVMSSGILKTAPSAADPSCSIEMWVKPALFQL